MICGFYSRWGLDVALVWNEEKLNSDKIAP